MGRLIDADAFDERIRLDVGSCEEELTEDFKDGISTILEMMKTAPTVDAAPVVRCKDCSKWCICYHSDNWFCADGTPINTASDFYDDKGKRLNNPKTYKSIYGERKDHETD